MYHIENIELEAKIERKGRAGCAGEPSLRADQLLGVRQLRERRAVRVRAAARRAARRRRRRRRAAGRRAPPPRRALQVTPAIYSPTKTSRAQSPTYSRSYLFL